MKAKLTITASGKPQLEIEPENDIEAIALQAWSEKYDRDNNEAYLIIKFIQLESA